MRMTRLERAWLTRGLMVWVGFRVALAVPPLGVADPNLAQEALLVGFVALTVLLDARRRGENLFAGNLGIDQSAIALRALPLALVAELLIP